MTKEKCHTYAQLGYCYRVAGSHQLSADYYLKMLQLAWDTNDNVKEIEAYMELSTQYYYLGELDKARYY